jgi:acyl-CoA synthetase (AMP-forming)/AMP-acid ligase II
MNLAAHLQRSAHAYGGRPAVALGERVLWDYATLGERAARLAGALRGPLGLAAGDRVAIIAKNCPEYVEMMYACWHAGLAAVPVNAKLHASEFAYVLENSGARAAFYTPDLAATVEGLDAPGCSLRVPVAGDAYGCWLTTRRRWHRATPTTWPGCSTPAAPRGARRARCSLTATCWPCARATSPTWIRAPPGLRSCTPRR